MVAPKSKLQSCTQRTLAAVIPLCESTLRTWLAWRQAVTWLWNMDPTSPCSTVGLREKVWWMTGRGLKNRTTQLNFTLWRASSLRLLLFAQGTLLTSVLLCFTCVLLWRMWALSRRNWLKTQYGLTGKTFRLGALKLGTCGISIGLTLLKIRKTRFTSLGSRM